MLDVEEQLRRYGEAAERAALLAEPEVWELSLEPEGGRRFRFWLVAAAALTAAAIAAGGLLSTKEERTRVAAVDRAATSTTDGAEVRPAVSFDLEAFAESKLNGAFEDVASAVAAVVLLPEKDNVGVEMAIASLTELEGYSFVPAADLSAAADGFAARTGSEPIGGRWVAYGLMPEFVDSPVDSWLVSLRTTIPDAVIVGTDFSVGVAGLPSGWIPLAELPIGLTDGSTVVPVDDLAVVVGPKATYVVHPDGAYETAPASPLASAVECCGSLYGLAVSRAVVLLEGQSAEAWLLDTELLTWTRLDDRPSFEFHVLGSAVLDGRLLVVSAAPRTGEAISAVVELDLATGSWEALPPLPVPISVGSVAVRDSLLTVAGTRQGPNNNIIGESGPTVLQFSYATGWTIREPAPISGQAAAVAPLPGGQLLAFNYGQEAALADSSGAWTRVDDVPMPESECYPYANQVASGVVAFCGGIAWWDPLTASWTQILSPTGVVATLRDGLVAFVEDGRDKISVFTYPLPPR